MLKINLQIIETLERANDIGELFPMLQSAIELEHSTIPPYLTALFSFKPDAGKEIRTIIHSIVIEEMLHMTIAANILNALGGTPEIANAKFVPDYPCQLPMGIASGLVVGIETFSLKLVEKVFMEIEEPGEPLPLKTKKTTLEAAAPTYKTIGDFYTALQKKINQLAPDKLPGDKSKQVTSHFFAPDVLYPILTKKDAIAAINIIIEQGEGTSKSPTDAEGEIAHYYRFQEIVKGRQLIKDPSEKYGYSFSGPPIVFDPASVLPLFPNTKATMLTEGSEERRLVDEFNNSYTQLLKGLHRTFNGEPDYLGNTIGVMFDLRLTCQKLAQTPFPGKPGYTIGPTYEFLVK